ncbi:MAG: glycine cleavage system aminomethyltransferase GcvT [Christensenellales bacterium]|jgi:aminomethyltransferase|nr:glycine cleavage system aminomethyltransferase GcvT [Clostridiales bacterium]
MKHTPFFEKMKADGAKMAEFAGYMLPMQFSNGIIAEHKAVRESAGLFDVSHMGEFIISGESARLTIQRLITNDISNMKNGQAKYTLMLNEKGGVVDDILVYRFNEQKYMLVVNAANREKDASWISSRLTGGASFEDISDQTALLALQGRKAIDIIKEFIPAQDIPPKSYTFTASELLGQKIILSRTGYTGEDGFEIYCGYDIAEKVYDLLKQKGLPYGMALCGLGARDTLRLEAGMPLYGHEMDEQTSAWEIGLDFFIKMDKDDFIGKAALEKTKPAYKRLGIKLTDRGIARQGALVYDGGGEQIGYVTSGTHSPTLGYPIAMIRVKKEFEGKELFVEVRNKKLRAEVCGLPFYKRNY